MNVLLFGIVITIIVIAFCGLAWWFKSRSNYSWAVISLVLAGIILRFFLASDNFLHPWDERYHALVAKNLLLHPFTPTLIENPILPFDYHNWTGNHVWVHKQPLSLWSIMMSYKLFGVNVIATRIPSILFSTLGIVLTYSIGRRLFRKEVGFIAAFLFTINGLIIEMTSGRIATDHVDVLFLFLILLAVYFAVRFSEGYHFIWNILCGIAIGLAILTKWLPALIVLPVWLSLVWNRREFGLSKVFFQGLLLCAIIAIVVLPWQFYIYSTFPLEAAWEREFNIRHVLEALDGQGQYFLYHFDFMRIAYGELIYLPIIWFAYEAFKSKLTDLKLWGILIWAIVPFIFFTFVATKMGGYTLFSASALFLITAVVYIKMRDVSAGSKYKWLLRFCCFLLLALPIRYSFERAKPFKNLSYEKAWNTEMLNFCKTLPKKGEKIVVHNVEHSIELMFQANVTAYPQKLQPNTIDSLEMCGFEVIEYK